MQLRLCFQFFPAYFAKSVIQTFETCFRELFVSAALGTRQKFGKLVSVHFSFLQIEKMPRQKAQWAKMTVDPWPEDMHVPIFCNGCGAKNRSDDGWWQSTEDNEKAKADVAKNSEMPSALKIIFNFPNWQRVYVCNLCIKEYRKRK